MADNKLTVQQQTTSSNNKENKEMKPKNVSHTVNKPKPKWDMLDTLTYKPWKKKRNVLTRMENELKDGPFSILYRSLDENLRVRVWTRSYNHVRGICTGYLAAYDKHWNLALYDVDEVYRNPMSILPVKQKKRAKKKKKANKNKDEKLSKNTEETTKVLLETDHNSLKQSGDTEMEIQVKSDNIETKDQSLVQSKMDNLKIKDSDNSANDSVQEEDFDKSLDDKDLVALKLEMERLQKKLDECPITSCAEDTATTSCTDDESVQSESESMKEQKPFIEIQSKLDLDYEDIQIVKKEGDLDSGSEAASEGSVDHDMKEENRVLDSDLESGELTSETDSEILESQSNIRKLESDSNVSNKELDDAKEPVSRKHKTGEKVKSCKTSKSLDLREKLLRQRTKHVGRDVRVKSRDRSKSSDTTKRSMSDSRIRKEYSPREFEDSRRQTSKSCDRRRTSIDRPDSTKNKYSSKKADSSPERERRDRSPSNRYSSRNRKSSPDKRDYLRDGNRKSDYNYRSSKENIRSQDLRDRDDKRSSSRYKRNSSRRSRDRDKLCTSGDRSRGDRKSTDSSEESDHNRDLSQKKRSKTRKGSKTASITKSQSEDQAMMSSSNQPAIPSLLSLKVIPPKPQSDVLQRHVNQLFIRGDNVVMVSLVK